MQTILGATEASSLHGALVQKMEKVWSIHLLWNAGGLLDFLGPCDNICLGDF